LMLKGHAHGEDAHGAHAHAEALPRIGIIIIGGILSMAFLGPIVGPMFGIEAPAHGGNAEAASAHPVSPITMWAFRAGVFAVGAVVGWLVSRLVNAAFAAFFKGFNWTFDVTIKGYGQIISLLLRVSVIVLFIYVGLLAGTVGMFQVVPGGFIPEQDKGYLVVNAQLQEGAALDRTDEVVRQMTDIALNDPEFKESVGHSISVPGYSILTGTNISNVGGMF